MTREIAVSPPPAPASPAVEAGARLRYPAAALSGVLMVSAFPRYGQDYLVWIALVPLFWAAAGAGWKRGFLSGWIAGLATVAGGFSWVLYSMRAFTGFGRAADAILFWPWLLWESLPWALLGVVLGGIVPSSLARGSSRRGLVMAALPLWVGIEHFFPHVFPWHLGGALYRRTYLVQCADLLGASGLTALVFVVNAAVYLVLLRLQGRARLPVRSLAAAVLILAGANLYGCIRLRHVEGALAAAPELKVGMVQPAALPSEKREIDLFYKMEARTRSLAQRSPLDLVLWPEGSDTIGYLFDPNGRPRREEMNVERKTGFENTTVPLVAGTGSIHQGSGLSRNTAAYILPGKWPPAGFYHKNIPVPFGEYVPFLDWLPDWLRSRIKNVGTIEAGKDCPLFELPRTGGPYRFRVLICYEAILPGYVREAARGADFLVNLTEDIWYGNTSHIEQHVSVLILRAVEQRTSIARSANVGPSGVIDPAGRMAERTAPYEKTERAFVLRPARLSSFHSRIGYAFPAVCLLLGGAGAAGLLRNRPRRENRREKW